MIRIISTGLIISALCIACENGTLASGEFEMPNNEWVKGDVKSIVINAPDTTQAYQLDIDVKHSEAYGYQNLYVKTITIFPSGKEVSSITSLELANPDGSWSGKCSGKSCSLSLPLQQGFSFPETGKYTWQIEPYMRTDTVNGIMSIGIECKKMKE